MSFGSKIPKHEEYEELKDTPYITSLRDLSQRGYEGYRDNYNKVNVFSPETQRSLDDYTNAVYKRAEGDFDRQYRDTMKRMANRNYGQFGTLNATPALYRTDMENLAQQRKLADMAYNKALYRESLVDNELRRRYNTLNMYNEMLEKGKTPYELDLKNWEIRNKNKDVRFGNAEIDANAGGGFKGALKGALQGAAAGLLASKLPIGGLGGAKGLLAGKLPIGALVGAAAGGFLGAQKKYVPSSVFSSTKVPDDLGYFGGNVGDYVGGLFTAFGKGGNKFPTTSGGNGGGLFDILGQYLGGSQSPLGNSGSAIQDAIGSFMSNQSEGGNSIMDAISDYIGGGAGDGSAISNAINSYTSSGGSNLGWLSKLKGLFSKGGGTATNFLNNSGGSLPKLGGGSSGSGVPWAMIGSLAKGGYNIISGHNDKDYSDLEESIIYPIQGASIGSMFGPWGALGGAAYGLGYSFRDDTNKWLGIKEGSFWDKLRYPIGMGDGGGFINFG